MKNFLGQKFHKMKSHNSENIETENKTNKPVEPQAHNQSPGVNIELVRPTTRKTLHSVQHYASDTGINNIKTLRVRTNEGTAGTRTEGQREEGKEREKRKCRIHYQHLLNINDFIKFNLKLGNNIPQNSRKQSKSFYILKFAEMMKNNERKEKKRRMKEK